ncbi:MAG: GNAT family N-acetyltransferase [Wenzhouxiangella sp.]
MSQLQEIGQWAPVWQLKPFDTLSNTELYALLQARVSVFVLEQACAYQELDGLDGSGLHLWCAEPEVGVLAYARLLPPGKRYAEASIGRVLTTEAGRGRGLGRQLMQQAIIESEQQFGRTGIRISAQCYLERFYRSFGFEAVGERYLEDDIPHQEMFRRPG